mmetsp:Transcript_41240/g.86200  ORF Transcript_41240/g.86200 Transcript_41240/m.86200 type:complete len:265 (-) Transcript_41240:228-1022(-)
MACSCAPYFCRGASSEALQACLPARLTSTAASRTHQQAHTAGPSASFCQCARGALSILGTHLLRPHRGCHGVAQMRSQRAVAKQVPSELVIAGDMIISFIAPTLEAFVLTGSGLYTPLWLIFGSAQPGSISPELRHGVVLALCWLCSATYAQGYAKEALDGQNLSELVWRLFVANFLNAWLIFFATSFFGLFEPFTEAEALRLGISPEAWGSLGFSLDVKVFRQVLDVNVDILVEALLLSAWHAFCAGSDLWEIWSLLVRQLRP